MHFHNYKVSEEEREPTVAPKDIHALSHVPFACRRRNQVRPMSWRSWRALRMEGGHFGG